MEWAICVHIIYVVYIEREFEGVIVLCIVLASKMNIFLDYPVQNLKNLKQTRNILKIQFSCVNQFSYFSVFIR